jgi:opacity protein-like surface antigen
MKRRLVILAAVVAVIGGAIAPAAAQDPPAPLPAGSGKTAPPPQKKRFRDRLYYGGNVGFSFGDVVYVDVSPYVGVNFGHDVSGGIGIFYRHREDNRYDPDLSTSDWGSSLFVRYRPAPQFFLDAEYSWTDFEYPLADGSTTREDYPGVLLGGGFVQPMGGRSAFIASVLYDVNWSEDELTPYDSPWLISAGVSVGF